MIEILKRLFGCGEKKTNMPVEYLPLTEEILLCHTLEYDLHELGMDCVYVTRDGCKASWMYNRRTHSVIPILGIGGSVLFLEECDIERTVAARIKSEHPHYWMRADFGFWIYPFVDGVARVEWTVYPDGRYWADDDGFGMTDDEEIILIGRIDDEGKAVCLFERFRSR